MPAEAFRAPFEVRVSDTDAQGHMNSSAYLDLANHSLWQCLRSAGVDVDELLRTRVGPVILESTIRYAAELRAGDRGDVSCRMTFDGSKTYLVHHELTKAGGDIAATIENRMGLLDLDERRLVPSPATTWRHAATRPEVLGLA
jgi:acyl-CoA thioester hydrolase